VSIVGGYLPLLAPVCLRNNPPANSGLCLIRNDGRTAPFVSEKEVRSMMTANSGLANRVIERIVELSADAQIERRMTAKDSPEFHQLAGAIAAYGEALSLLVAVREQEEFYEIMRELNLLVSVSERVH
jgi:hypothetical protein